MKDRLHVGKLTSQPPSRNPEPRFHRPHCRAPPPPVTFPRTNLSPPGCRPPLLLSCFRYCRRRRRRRRSDATRAGAPAAAALAQARPSVRTPGCALRTLASTTHLSRLTLFLPAPSLSPFPPCTPASGALGPAYPLRLGDGRGRKGG